MARAGVRRRRKTPKARPISIPAPMGGWNTRDGLDSMPPSDAVQLDNWIPGVGEVNTRWGYVSHVTGMGSSNVDTLAEYHSGTTRKLLAFANGNIYNATTTNTSIGSGFTNNQWQTANFNGSIFMVNGDDAPQDWDGTTLTSTAWTGPTVANLVGINVFKSRLYFFEKDTQDFWYAPAAAVTGALTKFPLSRVAGFGGNLIAMGTWTHDGGAGVDDHAVFIMSSGDVIVYQGSDPGSASDWALVGIYHIGTPLGVRGVAKIGGDLVLMTTEDYVTLSAVLTSGQIGSASKLSGAVKAASSNKALFGWQVVVDQSKELMIFNVPTIDGYDQHVTSTLTGSSSRLKDIPSRCWAVFNGDLYFGSTDGAVYKVSGNDDAGTAIEADSVGAWVSEMTRHRVTAARPVLAAFGGLSYSFAIGSDYTPPSDTAPVTTSATVSSPWPSPWPSPWSSEDSVSVGWIVASANGQAIAPRLKVSSTKAVEWLRTDYRVEQGINL